MAYNELAAQHTQMRTFCNIYWIGKSINKHRDKDILEQLLSRFLWLMLMIGPLSVQSVADTARHAFWSEWIDYRSNSWKEAGESRDAYIIHATALKYTQSWSRHTHSLHVREWSRLEADL